MATDPTLMVRKTDFDSPLTLDLRSALTRLAELEPSPDAPYITLCLD